MHSRRDGHEAPFRPLRVLLVQPPTTGCVTSLLPQVDEEGPGIGLKPPLGLLSIAAFLHARTPHRAEVLDCLALRLDVEAAAREIAARSPDVVGITAWTDFWYPAASLGRRVKELVPDVHLVYGGPHLGIYPAETLAMPFVDSVIVGDGETPLARLCDALAAGRPETAGQGWYTRAVPTPASEFVPHVERDLDALPFPDRTLVPVTAYGSVLSKDACVTTMITSRGCPNRCTFCKLHFQKTLCRSAESVVEEFRQIAALGIREVEIYDDTFTWSRQRVWDICQGLIEADLGVTFAVRDRVNRVDAETLDLLRRAGCTRVHYGVESGVDRVLRTMRKGITTDQARRAVALARKAGLTVLTYFMFGNLDETREDMRRTIDFALELDADYAEFSITIPYPGTELYRQALEQGIVTRDYWLDHAREPRPHFRPPQVIENLVDLAGLTALRDEAIRRFYFRPRYLLRQLRSLSSPAEFGRKARMGLKLLSGLARGARS